MKKNGLLILALAPCALFAQLDYQIKGQVGQVDAPAKVYLIQYGTSMKVDTAIISKGSFEFKGQVTDPSRSSIVLDYQGLGLNSITSKPDVLEVFLEKGKSGTWKVERVYNE